MKLYYKPGACSLATHIVLLEIGEPFELDKVDTKAKKTEAGEDYLAINPKGYVPALELDDGHIITENAAVLQYIADQYPEAELAPANGTLERTRLQEHLSYISAELHKSFSPLFAPNTSEDDKEKARKNIAPKLDYFESVFADGRRFLLGDKFSIADAYLFVVISWTRPNKIGLEKWPLLADFAAHVVARDSVKQAMRDEGLIK